MKIFCNNSQLVFNTSSIRVIAMSNIVHTNEYWNNSRSPMTTSVANTYDRSDAIEVTPETDVRFKMKTTNMVSFNVYFCDNTLNKIGEKSIGSAQLTSLDTGDFTVTVPSGCAKIVLNIRKTSEAVLDYEDAWIKAV